MSTQMEAGELHRNLRQFSGTENVFRHTLCRIFCYTDGVKYLAENAGAYWLLDAIGSYYGGKTALTKAFEKNERLKTLQIWLLEPTGENSAVLKCQEDTGPGEKVHVEQKIEYTDFPFENGETFKLFVSWTEVGGREAFLAMLPSEY